MFCQKECSSNKADESGQPYETMRANNPNTYRNDDREESKGQEVRIIMIAIHNPVDFCLLSADDGLAASSKGMFKHVASFRWPFIVAL
jgi:hypothetical protein